MQIKPVIPALILSLILLQGCQSSDSTLRAEGNSEAYVQGFHDGRHSGMKEAGNHWEHVVRDHTRFESEGDYKAGWLAGEEEGIKIQEQAASLGEAIGGGYSGYRIGKEADKAEPNPNKIAKDAMKGIDTNELKALEQ